MSAPNSPKIKRLEQAEDSSIDPSSSACEIRNQSRFCGNHSPRKLLPQNRVRISFRHLPRDLEGRTLKKNVLFFFKKNFTTTTSEKQGTFFFGVAE